MKKILSCIAVISILCACHSTSTVRNESAHTVEHHNIQNEQSVQTPSDSEDEPIDDVIIPFEFISANIGYDEADSQQTGESVYLVRYSISFQFLNKDSRFTVDYTVYDADNNELLHESDIRPNETEPHIYEAARRFNSPFNIETFRYMMTVHKDGQDYEYVGECHSENALSLNELHIGPIITRYETDSLVTYLSVSAKVSGECGIEWMRLIPPSEDYFWEIPFDKQGYIAEAAATISDTKHKRYLDNGTYIFQINAGRSGMIQKTIEITDYFNNTSGANYGFPVASEIESDKNRIVLDMDFREKADRMEVVIYTDYEGTLQKLGTAKLLLVQDELPKKELLKAFTDDFGSKVKLKNNKKYYYQVYLYSKEFNGLSYISVSEMMPIVFQGFSLW